MGKQSRKGFRVGSRKPGLNAEGADFLEQGRAAHVVQMRRDVVEKEQRRQVPVPHQGAQIGQHDRDQQRFLFAGRTEIGGTILGAMHDQQIAAMRAGRRRAVLRILVARAGKLEAQHIFDRQGRIGFQRILGHAP